MAAESGAARHVPRAELPRAADHVTRHAPLTDETAHRAAVGAVRDPRSTP